MGIVNMLEDLLGGKVKKAAKLMDVGLDVAEGAVDAAKGAIKTTAIAALKERANSVARDWLLQTYGLDVGKGGINPASLTRLVNAALATQTTPPLELSNIGDVRAMRNEITKYGVERILEEYGYKTPTEMMEKIVVKAREKIGTEIENMGVILDSFRPDPITLRILDEYGEPKPPVVSQLPPAVADGNRERQKRYRANHRGE